MELLIDGRVLEGEAELFEGQWAELSASPPSGARLELLVGETQLEAFLRPGDPAWRWRWLAPGAAGAYRLALRATMPDGSADELRRVLRVAPRKLDQDRYAALLDDLQRLGRALVFALTGGAEGAAAPREPDTSAPTAAEELHGLFGAELDRLAPAVERLARRPPDRLRQRIEPTDPARARDLSAVDWSRLVGGAGEGAAQQAASLASLPIRQPLQAYDTYEARLLRRLLESLWRRLERLPGRAQLPPELAARADAARARLRELRGLPFLAEVPPLSDYRGPTPRLQRDPEYRSVFRMWQLLRRRPLIAWEDATIDIPVGDLPRLYERWCAASAAIVLLTLPGHRVLSQAILREEGDEQLLALPEGRPLVRLESPQGAELTLRYHPRYAGGAPLNRPSAPLNAADAAVPPRLVSLDRHSRVPDLAIEVRRPGAPPAVLVLDAKYRLDATGGVPEDALADAYSYLGSIGTAAGERAAAAAALLYPGRGRAEIYASGAAALPLLPGEDEALRQWLTEQVGGLEREGRLDREIHET